MVRPGTGRGAADRVQHRQAVAGASRLRLVCSALPIGPRPLHSCTRFGLSGITMPLQYWEIYCLQARIGFSVACFYTAVVVLIVQTVFRYEKPDRQADSRSGSHHLYCLCDMGDSCQPVPCSFTVRTVWSREFLRSLRQYLPS